MNRKVCDHIVLDSYDHGGPIFRCFDARNRIRAGFTKHFEDLTPALASASLRLNVRTRAPHNLRPFVWSASSSDRGRSDFRAGYSCGT